MRSRLCNYDIYLVCTSDICQNAWSFLSQCVFKLLNFLFLFICASKFFSKSFILFFVVFFRLDWFSAVVFIRYHHICIVIDRYSIFLVYFVCIFSTFLSFHFYSDVGHFIRKMWANLFVHLRIGLHENKQSVCFTNFCMEPSSNLSISGYFNFLYGIKIQRWFLPLDLTKWCLFSFQTICGQPRAAFWLFLPRQFICNVGFYSLCIKANISPLLFDIDRVFWYT